jgi:ASC-1-like (ASCH) protein
VYQGSVAGKRLDLFVGDNEATDSFGQVNQEAGVADVVFCDLGLVTSCLKVFSRARSKHRQSNYGVTAHDSAILDEHRIKNSHPELLLKHVANMFVQLI